MSILNPYLIFNGTAEQAFNFYKSVFGGDFTALMRMGDAPTGSPTPLSDQEKNLLMHISLPIGQSNVLMASDNLPSMGHPFVQGNNVQISITPDSEEEARRLFEGLSKNGIVETPLQDMFWGALFGMFTDQFGIRWMVNFERAQKN